MINREHQFYHARLHKDDWSEYTVVVKDLNKKVFEDLAKNFLKYDIELLQDFHIGYSIVHPNDNFCKKTGRDTAIARIKHKVFKLVNLDMSKERKMFIFEANDKDYPITQLYFEFKGERPSVFLTHATRKL